MDSSLLAKGIFLMPVSLDFPIACGLPWGEMNSQNTQMFGRERGAQIQVTKMPSALKRAG